MSNGRPNPLRMVSHALAALFNSRSAFLEQWRRYEAHTAPAQGLAGRWTGEWISDANGHHGDLKCVLEPVSAALYRAHFYASFARVFKVGYATDLSLEQSDGHARLRGEADLGALAGGTYRCAGEVTGNKLECRYQCRYDHGLFRLNRLD
jgi:hypothetical protein